MCRRAQSRKVPMRRQADEIDADLATGRGEADVGHAPVSARAGRPVIANPSFHLM